MVIEQIAREVIQNYPEYSSEHIKCKSWGNYKDCMEFLVEDNNGEGIYTLMTIGENPGCDYGFEDVGKALKKLIHNHIDKPYAFYKWDPFDPGTYDAEVVDTMMQTLFYGDVIYG